MHPVCGLRTAGAPVPFLDAAQAVNPPIFTLFVQGGQYKPPYSTTYGEKIIDQNNKELWRNTLTTGDTSSREEVRP